MLFIISLLYAVAAACSTSGWSTRCSSNSAGARPPQSDRSRLPFPFTPSLPFSSPANKSQCTATTTQLAPGFSSSSNLDPEIIHDDPSQHGVELCCAADEACCRRGASAKILPWLKPVVSLFARAVVLLLAAGVLAVTATIPGELRAPGSALRLATLQTTSAAILQLAWVLPLAVLDAAAALGNRPPRRFRARAYLGVAGGDLVAAIASLTAASGSVGMAVFAASVEFAGWPWGPRYVSVVAASFLGFPALLATMMLDRLHAAACERNMEF